MIEIVEVVHRLTKVVDELIEMIGPRPHPEHRELDPPALPEFIALRAELEQILTLTRAAHAHEVTRTVPRTGRIAIQHCACGAYRDVVITDWGAPAISKWYEP